MTFESAKRKLANHPTPLDLAYLPDIQDPFWNTVQSTYELTVPEVCALKTFKAQQHQQQQIGSPRLGRCVYVLIYMVPNTFPILLGTAWAVESLSRTLLLSARHCLDPVYRSSGNLDHLFILDSISSNDDGTVTLDPCQPLSVRCLAADEKADVLILQATSPFADSIRLCPRDQFPTILNEDKVKTYHCPCQAFPETLPVMGQTSTSYDKVKMESRHHFFLSNEHMRGSSGGVVVDQQCRAVGIICSGNVPGIQLPIPDEFHTLWETVTILSEGRGIFIRCVKLNQINQLYEYLTTH